MMTNSQKQRIETALCLKDDYETFKQRAEVLRERLLQHADRFAGLAEPTLRGVVPALRISSSGAEQAVEIRHLTVDQVYRPLAKSDGKVLNFTRESRAQNGEPNGSLHQFLT
jgi:hypothetical protein